MESGKVDFSPKRAGTRPLDWKEQQRKDTSANERLSVKQKARGSLLAAKRDGTLDRIASDMDSGKLDFSPKRAGTRPLAQKERRPQETSSDLTVKAKARGSLLAAKKDGTLERIANDMESGKVSLSQPQHTQQASSRPVAGNEKDSSSGQSVKAKAKSGLLAAKKDGTLERIANDMENGKADLSPKQAGSRPGDRRRQDSSSGQSVKAKAKSGLLAAKKDGTLERIANDMESSKVDLSAKQDAARKEVKAKARRSLLAAKQDGSLELIAADMEESAKKSVTGPGPGDWRNKELPPLNGTLPSPRGPRPPLNFRRPPTEEEVFSEASLKKLAQKQLEKSMHLAAMNTPSATNYPQPFGGMQNLKLEALSQEAQKSFMRAAVFEAEATLRQERQRWQIEAKVAKRQATLAEQLGQWYERKQKAEDENRAKEELRERQKSEKERLEQERWKKRNDELHLKVAEWAAEKGQREFEQSQAEEEAAKKEAERRKKREAQRQQQQKEALDQWYQKRAEEKLRAAEERRRSTDSEQKLEMQKSKGKLPYRVRGKKKGHKRRRPGGEKFSEEAEAPDNEQIIEEDLPNM